MAPLQIRGQAPAKNARDGRPLDCGGQQGNLNQTAPVGNSSTCLHKSLMPSCLKFPQRTGKPQSSHSCGQVKHMLTRASARSCSSARSFPRKQGNFNLTAPGCNSSSSFQPVIRYVLATAPKSSVTSAFATLTLTVISFTSNS